MATSRRGLKGSTWKEWEDLYNSSSIELKRKKRLSKYQLINYDPDTQLALQDQKRLLILDITSLHAEIDGLNDHYTKLYQQSQLSNQNLYQKKERELIRNPPTEKTEDLQNEYDYEVKRNKRITKETSPEIITKLQNEIQMLTAFIIHHSELLEQQKDKLHVINRFIKAQKLDEQDKIIMQQAEQIRKLRTVLDALETQESELNNQFTDFMSSTSKIASNRIKMQKLERKLKILDFEKLAKEENYNKTKLLYERKIQNAKQENKQKNRIKAEQQERIQFSKMMEKRRKEQQEEKERLKQERNVQNKKVNKTMKTPPATPKSTRTVYSIDENDDNSMNESTEQMQKNEFTVSPKFGTQFEPFTQKQSNNNNVQFSKESTAFNSAIQTPSQYESTAFTDTTQNSSELPSAIPRNIAPPNSSKPIQQSPRKQFKSNQSNTTSNEIFSPSTINDILSDFTPKTQQQKEEISSINQQKQNSPFINQEKEDSPSLNEQKQNSSSINQQKEDKEENQQQQQNSLKLSTIIPSTIKNESQTNDDNDKQKENKDKPSENIPTPIPQKANQQNANIQPHPPDQKTPQKINKESIQIPESGGRTTSLADDEREYSYYSDYYSD